MTFYDRLKEGRVKAGLTQEQLAEKLGVAKSTLSGYESGKREPTVATIAKALEILDIDANYLYQDETKTLTELVVSLDDREFLQKYRSLDSHGKEMVDVVLEKEYARWQSEHSQPATLKDAAFYEPSVLAAHARTDKESTPEGQAHDLDIMFDNKEWK